MQHLVHNQMCSFASSHYYHWDGIPFPVTFQILAILFKIINIQGKWGSARVIHPIVGLKRKKPIGKEKMVWQILVDHTTKMPPVSYDPTINFPVLHVTSLPAVRHHLVTCSWPWDSFRLGRKDGHIGKYPMSGFPSFPHYFSWVFLVTHYIVVCKDTDMKPSISWSRILGLGLWSLSLQWCHKVTTIMKVTIRTLRSLE